MTASNSFDTNAILDGIRQWVEIETPTEAPNRSTGWRRSSPTATAICRRAVERVAGQGRLRRSPGCAVVLGTGCTPGILVLSHLDTVHPLGFINRLPFRIEGDSAFGPGIYDMKGGAYLAYHAFRQLAGRERSPLGVTQLYVSDEEIGSPTSRALIEAKGAPGQICAGDRTGARRRQGRHRTEGRGTLRGLHQGLAGPCRTRPEDGRSAIREFANVIELWKR